MPFEDAQGSLKDIRESIQAIQEFISGLSSEAFEQDAKSRAAVERKLLVISEAAVRLGQRAEPLCPGVPWQDIRGIGNWLRHQYDRVDAEIIWNTIQDDLPPLMASVEKALAQPGQT